jgi:hypothetical protein
MDVWGQCAGVVVRLIRPPIEAHAVRIMPISVPMMVRIRSLSFYFAVIKSFTWAKNTSRKSADIFWVIHIACCLIAFCILERERHTRRLSVYKPKRQLNFQGRSLVLPALDRLRRAAQLLYNVKRMLALTVWSDHMPTAKWRHYRHAMRCLEETMLWSIIDTPRRSGARPDDLLSRQAFLQ